MSGDTRLRDDLWDVARMPGGRGLVAVPLLILVAVLFAPAAAWRRIFG
jgi:hypothetical protein